MSSDSQQDQQQKAYERAMLVLEARKEELLAKANVVGLGVGLKQVENQITNQIAIVVMVNHKRPSAELPPVEQIPSQIEGVDIDVQEVGDWEAQG
jgi:hypothetical protein